jgi:hypothetical protein
MVLKFGVVIDLQGSRRMIHVAHMGDMRNMYRILVRKTNDHSEDLDVDGKLILERISGK